MVVHCSTPRPLHHPPAVTVKPRHLVQLAALSSLWGASFLLIRIASPVMGPAVLAALRIALATLTLAALMRALGQRWPLAHWRELGLLGLLSVAAPFLLFAWAGLHLPSGYSALLNSTAVIFGLLASAHLGEDRLTLRKLLGCATGFVGVGLIVGLGPVEFTPLTALAVVACVLASACYGVCTPLMKRAMARMQPLPMAAGIHLLSLLALLPGAAWSLPQAHFSAPALAAVALMGVLTSGLAYWGHLRIMAHITPVAAMSPIFMIPMFGVLWGHAVLDEPLGTGLFLGGALILAACALVTDIPLRRPPPCAVDAQP